MFRPALTALALIAGLLALAPAASAGSSKHLWATVNICDTDRQPNKMGVRARMPGDGTRRRMFMRFTAQYRTGGRWRKVAGEPSSGWLPAGSALFRFQELGYTFSFDPPPKGGSYLMRGRVDFQWRRRSGRVVRRARRVTERGHPSRGADPEGHSRGRCRIR